MGESVHRVPVAGGIHMRRVCGNARGLVAGTCRRCKREVAGACVGCVEAVHRMCSGCRTRERDRSDGVERGQRRRATDDWDTRLTVAEAGSSGPDGRKRQCRHGGGDTTTMRTVTGRAKVTKNVHKRQSVDALSAKARWRRRTVEGCATEYVDFWEDADKGWVTRFHIRKDGAVAGRGLFAARDYAKGEYMTVYMGGYGRC